MQEGLFSDPAVWVALAFVILVAGLFKPVSKLMAKGLDERSAKIAEELAAASRLREEAEEVLAVYKKKQAEYTKEAEQILKRAREEADNNAKHGDLELKAALEARTANALEKIAQEESRAIAEVRAHIVDISLAAAKAIVTDQVSKTSQQELMKLALADIDRKIH